MFNTQLSAINPDDVLVYLRKSRSDDPTLTVEEVLSKHETMLDEWVEKNLGGIIPEKNKFREVVSGETISDRPEIQTLLKKIESPKYKAVLVVEVQRLSRGDLMDAGLLIRTFRYTNTLVFTLQRTYDIRDDYDRDYFERELKRGNEFLEYQKRIMNNGRLLSVSQGNYIGNAPPYGYDRVFIMDGKRKCPTLKPNPEQAPVVQMIFDLYVNQNMGYANIAHHLDKLKIPAPKGERWSPAALKDMLSNIHYIGRVRWNNRKTITLIEDGEVRKSRPNANASDILIYDGKHEAIITEELFYAAQSKMGKNPRAPAKAKVRNPFAGIIYCKCGRAMTYRTYKSTDGSERNPPRLICDNQTHCHTGSILFSDMVNRVYEVLEQCIEDFEIKVNEDTGEALKRHNRLIKSLENRLKEAEKKELSQWEQQSHPDPAQRMPPAIFQKLNEKVLAEKEEINAALQKAYEAAPQNIDYKKKLAKFQDALAALKDPTLDALVKNRLLKDCLDRIEYSREAPQRVKSTEKKVTVNGRRIKQNPIKPEERWTSPPVNLEVKIKV